MTRQALAEPAETAHTACEWTKHAEKTKAKRGRTREYFLFGAVREGESKEAFKARVIAHLKAQGILKADGTNNLGQDGEAEGGKIRKEGGKDRETK